MKHISYLMFVSALILASCESSNTQTNAGNDAGNTKTVAKTPEELNKAKSIEDWKNEIKNNPEWLAQVVEKAKKLNKTVDEMIQIDAEWSYSQFHSMEEQQTLKLKSKSVEDWKLEIKKNPTWMSQITKKAKDKGISVDSMITVDAIYSYEQFNK